MSALVLIACLMWEPSSQPEAKLLALVELQRPCPVVKL